jgi:hypothetical protein
MELLKIWETLGLIAQFVSKSTRKVKTQFVLVQLRNPNLAYIWVHIIIFFFFLKLIVSSYSVFPFVLLPIKFVFHNFCSIILD